MHAAWLSVGTAWQKSATKPRSQRCYITPKDGFRGRGSEPGSSPTLQLVWHRWLQQLPVRAHFLRDVQLLILGGRRKTKIYLWERLPATLGVCSGHQGHAKHANSQPRNWSSRMPLHPDSEHLSSTDWSHPASRRCCFDRTGSMPLTLRLL